MRQVRTDPRRDGVLIGEGWMRIPTPMPDGWSSRLMVVRYDVSDAELIEQFRWHVRPDFRTFYAAASVPVRFFDLYGNYVTMHKLLMPNAGEGRVSHLDGNGLDNRRRNLRVMTQEEVLAKRRPSGGSSKYKGVCWDGAYGKWLVAFRGKKVGRFRDEEEAARAFDEAAFAHWGGLAYLNFPRDEAS